MDNEAERQKYEIQQSQRVHQQGLHEVVEAQQLGTERLNAQQPFPRDAQINESRRMDRRLVGPRSADLQQLYHEAIPMNKALSHSGPSAFGNGLIVSFIESLFLFYVHFTII